MADSEARRPAGAGRFPNRIREIREMRDYTLEELAKRIPGEISYQTVSRLERGETRLTDGYMQRLAVALGVHPMELLIDGPGVVKRSDLVSLDPDEKRLLEAIRTMPPRERARLLDICRAAAPEYFAAA